MFAEGVDHHIVRGFWTRKSLESSTRWTPKATLDFELGYLRDVTRRPRSVLDLGSGHGELSRPLAEQWGARLVAVDFAPAYARSFTSPRERFVEAGATEFDTSERFDLALLFGIVTCLDEADEPALYAKVARWVSSGGVAVVKNQCAHGEGFVVTGYSEQLRSEYSGRYPNVSDQHGRLLEAFSVVDRIDYPQHFNPWVDCAHFAFVCRP